MNPTLVLSKEKVRGCSRKYNWHAFLKARNLLRSPENLSGVGTRGSGGGTTTVGTDADVAGAEGGGAVAVRCAEVPGDSDSTLCSS